MTRVGSVYLLRPSRPEDARAIIPSVRPVDKDEWDASEPGGLEHLEASIQAADECWTLAKACSPMEPQVIGGVSHGRVCWLLGTALAEQDAFWLQADTRAFWHGLFARWPYLECWSDARNVTHHRWLTWLGFRLHAVEPWGHLGLPFHHFIRG
jgi:hypothetical protein